MICYYKKQNAVYKFELLPHGATIGKAFLLGFAKKL